MLVAGDWAMSGAGVRELAPTRSPNLRAPSCTTRAAACDMLRSFSTALVLTVAACTESDAQLRRDPLNDWGPVRRCQRVRGGHRACSETRGHHPLRTDNGQ